MPNTQTETVAALIKNGLTYDQAIIIVIKRFNLTPTSLLQLARDYSNYQPR